MKERRISKDGEKALEGRKFINENERLSPKSMRDRVGSDVYKRGEGLVWKTAKNKKGRESVLRDSGVESSRNKNKYWLE